MIGSFLSLSAKLFQQKPKNTISKEETQRRRDRFEGFVNALQKEFVSVLQQYETKQQFIRDEWQRKDGHGGGLTCVMQDGNFFEKAGVNTSKITFPLNKAIAASMKERGKELSDEQITRYNIYANGISLVIHPINPFVPTVHANYRIMEIYDRETGETIDSWFGGGGDLTPNYLFEEDARTFHQGFKTAMEPFGEELFPKFKKNCDEYFFIKFRNERRGVGGIFFDDFILGDNDWEMTFEFVNAVGWSTLRSYDTIVARRQNTEYTPENLKWKEIRRGRYVEFNLVYDRGTKFGLATPDARIESILMSLPHNAKWEYMYQVAPGSEEERLQKVLITPVDWV